MVDHLNAAQVAKQTREDREQLVRRIKEMEVRKQSVELVVKLAEHVNVGDPVELARRIYDFIDDGSYTEASSS